MSQPTGKRAYVSKSSVEGTLEELRLFLPEANGWRILQDSENGYGLYARGENGQLTEIAQLGETAPNAVNFLNGMILGISRTMDKTNICEDHDM